MRDIVTRLREDARGCPFPNVYSTMQEAAQEIERLRAELAVAMRERNDAIQASLWIERECNDLADEKKLHMKMRRKAEAELAAAREDAERYRWLRVNWGENSDGWWDHGISPGKLDSVIDAALDAREKGGRA